MDISPVLGVCSPVLPLVDIEKCNRIISFNRFRTTQ